MKNRTRTYNATLRLTRSQGRSPWRRFCLVVPPVFVWLVFSQIMRAVDPPPDGGYANENTAEGDFALFSLSIGSDNTAIGNGALFRNTTGSFNTATGASALESNTTGSDNTANGYESLFSNTTGIDNTASGVFALFDNVTGSYNTATGDGAMEFNSAGSSNTASGFNALYSNTTGNNNIGLGAGSGGNLTTGNNNIDIGNGGVAAESNIIRIGSTGTQTATFIAGIRGVAVAGGQPVAVSASGQLGIRASAARFKENIMPMDRRSEAILSFKPVTFRYKKELDPKKEPQFGLVAEEVAKVAPDLVTRDDQGQPFSVRYDEVNAMLLNEFIKEHRKVEKLEAARAQQKARFAKQEREIKALSASLQTVSDQLATASLSCGELELTSRAPRVAVNNP